MATFSIAVCFSLFGQKLQDNTEESVKKQRKDNKKKVT